MVGDLHVNYHGKHAHLLTELMLQSFISGQDTFQNPERVTLHYMAEHIIK